MARRPAAATRVLDRPVECIIYLRLSDLHADDLNENGQGKTFDAREQKLREYAKYLGWTVRRVVIENDMGAKDGKHRNASAFKRRTITLADGSKVLRVWRPGFRSILDDLAHGRGNALIGEDLDRVFRDPRDLEDFIDVAEANKVNARSLAGSLTFTDGGTDSEITMARMMVAVGNKSSRDTQRRVRAGRERKALNGEFGGGPRPYGFDTDGVTKRPDECAVIAKASRRVLQIDGRKNRYGKLTSLRLLAAELREQGVPTATGAPWSPSTLRDILVRPRNAGIMVYQGEEIGKAPWKPIVSERVFRAVVSVLTDPARRTNAEQGSTPRWLGSGIYLCGICADGTTCWVTGGKDRPRRYACKRSNHLVRNAENLDAYVTATILERLSRPDAADLFAVETGPEVDLTALRTEAAAIRQNLNELAADRAVNRITREAFLSGTDEGQKRLGEITELLSNAAVESPAVPLLDADDMAAAWADQPLAVKRAVLQTLCTVTILPGARRRPGFDPSAVSITPNTPAPTRPGDVVRSLPTAA